MKNRNRIKLHEKTQIGGRVPKGMNLRLQLVSSLVGQTKDQILQDSLAVSFGSADAEAIKRNNAVRTASKQLEGVSPFELPLTPIKNNAILTSRGDSHKLTIRFKRMGS
jgi:hypothetical protein